MIDFVTLAHQCAPTVDPTTLAAVVRTESAFNPYAIGVVGGHLVRQPRSLPEAVATAHSLESQGINFSMGLGQVNRTNLAKYGMTYETAFDPCLNLKAGGAILTDCYARAARMLGPGGPALKAAISCYYSGNFKTGLKRDFGGTSYVQRVAFNALSVDTVPAIRAVMDVVTTAQSAKQSVAAAPKASRAVAAKHEKNPTASDPAQGQAQPESDDTGWDAFGDFKR
ncbi:Type IV secretion system protein virB1 [Paraburkholderia tropica]|uniref:lytic transglycosylase domain-containing protein n=1 Tax=Paraburkholderia tropica TaxID=92647 RepID=UPI001CB2477E|nr:lytic transglycosylase domain-containing protein [Paraburkholderia tropica]CAG9235722.1 Type IV secretion system protein virB1 [Paraburkholderia tropica]